MNIAALVSQYEGVLFAEIFWNCLVRRKKLKRRDFLISTSSLLLTPELSRSQGTTTPASTTDDIIFEDFESGTYDGWTLEGNCWLPQPASMQTFLDPRTKQSVVTGIGGKRFLVSFHRSPAETGKATSKDFTITKPFINFRIGGGHYPNQACLNLVVDGKVVRTETGNDSNELVPACWDVYALLSKKAHLEVVDTTMAAPRGYIMVDDIRLSEKPNTRLQLNCEQLAEQYRSKYGLPGIFIGVIQHGEITACVAQGVRKTGDSTPITSYDQMMLGSISKPVTGFIIASIVREGRLSWNSKFNEICPEIARGFAHPGIHATLCQLMNHTSGITYPASGESNTRPSTPQQWRVEMIKAMLSLKPAGEPGQVISYSDGVDFAVTMAEKVTGLSFDQLIQRYLCLPLGLRSLQLGDSGMNTGSPTSPRGHLFDKATGRFVGYGDDATFHSLKWRSCSAGAFSCSGFDALKFAGFLASRNGSATQATPKALVYDNQFFNDIFTLPNKWNVSEYTNGGWSAWSNLRCFTHLGNTGRGEKANMQVLLNGEVGTFVYYNKNYTDQSLDIPELIQSINSLVGY